MSSDHAASNSSIERFHSSLSKSLKTSVTQNKDWIKMLPFVELAFPSSPVKGLGVSSYEIRQSGYPMGLPIDIIMLKKFDEAHHSPPRYIVQMRSNIDRLNYITLQKKKKINWL